MKQTLNKMHTNHGTKRANARWSWAGCNDYLVLFHLWFDRMNADSTEGLIYDPSWHDNSHPAHKDMKAMIDSVVNGQKLCKVVLLEAANIDETPRQTKYIYPLAFEVTIRVDKSGAVYATRTKYSCFPTREA